MMRYINLRFTLHYITSLKSGPARPGRFLAWKLDGFPHLIR